MPLKFQVLANKKATFNKDLFDRAKKGDVSLLKEISPDILTIKYGDEDSTILHELAKNGVTDVSKLNSNLLTVQDASGRTPIHYLAMTKAASQWKTFKQAAFDVQDEDGKTPVHLLAEHFDVSSLPAKYLSIKDYEDYNTPVHVMCESEVPFNVMAIPESIMKMANVLGETPAHLLAYNSDKDFVKCPTQDVKNANGQTPLEIYQERAEASAEVTASYKTWMAAKKKKSKETLQNYFELGCLKFYWSVGEQNRIYTCTLDNGETISFALFKKDTRNDMQFNCSVEVLPVRDNYIQVFALISGEDCPARDLLVEYLLDKGVECFDVNRMGIGEDSIEVNADAHAVEALTSRKRKSASELAKMKIKRRQNRVKLRMQRLRRKNKVKSVKRQKAAKRGYKTRRRLYGK